MTPEHEAFLQYLSKNHGFTEDVLRKHWTKGKRYYIDNRVDISGHRREFNRLNKMMGE
jgi:hypothetical protein